MCDAIPCHHVCSVQQCCHHLTVCVKYSKFVKVMHKMLLISLFISSCSVFWYIAWIWDDFYVMWVCFHLCWQRSVPEIAAYRKFPSLCTIFFWLLLEFKLIDWGIGEDRTDSVKLFWAMKQLLFLLLLIMIFSSFVSCCTCCILCTVCIWKS